MSDCQSCQEWRYHCNNLESRIRDLEEQVREEREKRSEA